MAQKDPWAEFEPVTAQPTTTGPTVQTIYTAPDPQGDAANARAEQAAAIAAQGNARANEAAARAAAEFAAKYNPDGSLKPDAGKPTEAQSKASGFLTRALGAAADFDSVASIGPRGMVGEAIAGAMPGVANQFASADRQRFQAAQDAFIAAVLRQDSGAALTQGELDTARHIYFPMPGDGPEVIAQKARQRALAIEGLKAAAGPTAGQAIAAFQSQQAQAQQGADAGNEEPGLTGSVTDDAPRRPGDITSAEVAAVTGNSPAYQQIAAGFGDLVQGAGDVVGLVSNPLNATVNAATGSHLTTDMGGYLRDLSGLPQGNETISTINRAGIGAMLPGMAAAKMAQVANPGAWQAALSELGASPLRDLVSGAAAGGAGEGAKAAGYGPVVQAGATLVGGMVGAGAGARMAPGRALPPSGGGGVNPTMESAGRLNAQFGTNIEPLPADVGGPTVRRATGAAAQMPLSAAPIVKGAQRVSDEAQKARDAIASLAGDPTTREGAGEAALNGAKKFIQTSRTKVNALYEKARKLGGNEPVDLAEARGTLDAHIAELEQVPGGADGLPYLQNLRADLNKPFAVEAVRQMRTQMRDKFIGDGLRGSDLERRVGMVLDAADQDITNGLNNAGKGDAARAYAEASAAHKERVSVIDNVLAPIIGSRGDAPKSVEQVMGAIETATKTNGGRLGKFLSALPDDDAATVRGTLIAQLGKASKGTQNAEGDAFSLPQFLTHWNAMSGSAKSQLFGGELRAALEDLAKVAQGTKEAQRFGNFSNTGGAVGLATTLTGGAIGGASHPIATVVALAGQYGLGKLLAWPSFARWLAKVPANNPAMMPKHIGSLSRIAASDSVIAADAIGLQRRLYEAFGASPLPVAAQSPDPNAGTESATTGRAPQ